MIKDSVSFTLQRQPAHPKVSFLWNLPDIPVTRKTLTRFMIPLGATLRQLGKEFLICVVLTLSALILSGFLRLTTFLPFMHWAHDLNDDKILRGTAYVALCVTLPWLLSRIFLPRRAHRLILLLRIILPLTASLFLIFEGG